MPDDLDAYLNPPASRSRRGSYDDLITKHATRTGLDPDLVRAVVGQESGGNPRAVSPKGAQGLGQLMPATARRFNVRDVNDPDENLRGATDYLKFLNNRYKGNRDLVLAGYNAGEGAVDKYGGIPPYRETRNYVKSINARLGQQGRQSQQTQKPVDDLDRYLEPAAPAREDVEASSSQPPRPRRRSQPPPITTALDQLTQQVNQSIAQVRGSGQGSQGVADLRRLDDPEVARIQRLQSEEAQRNPELAHLRPALAASRAAQRAAQRASEERVTEERQRQQAPELDRLTAIYRKQIREAQNHGIGPEQWLNEAAAKGVGGLLEMGAGVVRGARYNPLAVGAAPTADKLALHAQALQRAAVEEGADRNVVSSTVQDALAGFVSTAPELAATTIGIPAIGAFGAGGGLRAYGRGGDTREVAKGAAHGLATGAAFELPVPSGITRPLTRAAAKAGTVGAATTGVELASGTPAQQAVATGITNALFAGHGELRRGVTPRQVEEVMAEVPESLRTRAEVRRVIDEREQTRQNEARDTAAVDTSRDTVDVNSRGEALSASGLERLSEAGRRTEPATTFGTGGGSSEPISRRGRVIDERQTTTQPNVPAQREAAEPDRQGRERFTVLDSDVTTTKTLSNETVSESANAESQPRRWLHADFGEVVESPNQRRLGKGRVRVTDTDGREHVIKRAALTGAGNQRAIPVKPEPETKPEVAPEPLDQYLEPASTPPSSATPPPAEGTSPTPSSPREVRPSTVTEPVTELPRLTSAKDAAMAADRERLGLPPLERVAPETSQQWLDEAKSRNAADPRAPDALVEQALAGNKNFTDVETMQVNLRAVELNNRIEKLNREIADSSDLQVIKEKTAEQDGLLSEYDRISRADDLAGAEWSRAGTARQRALKEDFSLASMIAKVKKDFAKDGRTAPPELIAEVKQLRERIVKAESERDVANERAAQAELQKQINRASRRFGRQETKQVLDEEFAQLTSDFRAKMRGVQPSGIDPTLIPIVAKMARNRVRAGITDAAQLVDDIHAALAEHVEGLTKRDIRDAISGYGLELRGDRRSEAAQQLAGIRTELRNLSKSEDVTAGRRLSQQDTTRQRQLERQAAELQRRIDTGDFEQPARQRSVYTRETYAKERAVNDLKAEFEKLRYQATRSFGGKLTDTAIGTANVPKTMLSMGDLSAVLRQGGIGDLQHPILSARAARDMLTAFTRHGFANVENAIKTSPEFENARRSGVEFTGVDQTDPRLTRREEGYLGSSAIDALAKGRFNFPGKALKEVKDFSERTFVSFLDSQRMRIFEQQANALRDMGLTGRQLDAAMKSQAKYINIITGRGSLGRATQYGPALNLLQFSPRLVVSRFQFLNKMVNPVAWARMPEGARRLQMTDNIKFLVGTATVLGLAKAAGADVSLDPDDPEFLKVKVWNTRYDTLAGLQQPMRFMIRMAKAIRGGETYSGDTKGDIFADFARSKASPEVGLAWDYLEGKNRLTGKRFEPGADTARAVVPLPVQDFREAIKQDGALRGSAEALPGLLGIGVQTYLGAAEKATTPAEKLARRKLVQRMPDEARTQAEIDADTQRSQLRARSRRGEDVSADITALGAKLTERQAKAILAARNKTRLQEDFNRLGIKDALVVYSVASEAERKQLQDTLERKAPLVDTLPPDEQAAVRERMRSFGMVPGQRPRERRPRTERPERRNRNRESYVFPE